MIVVVVVDGHRSLPQRSSLVKMTTKKNNHSNSNNYNNLLILKTLKRIIHIIIGIFIGFLLTHHFRSINYENFKNDLLHQFCSYTSWKLWGGEDIIHVSTGKDLAVTFESVREIISRSPKDGRRLLLVGVMTAKTFFDTRASTIYRTWGQDLLGDILFFTSSNQTSETKIPYVALPGVDDSYPPQKKSFLMLKFMSDHFGDRYKFFMRADDDVFVNVEKLKTFLASLNSSEQIYIGQTGVGNKQEFGQLNLDSHENFCMGGPGVIFSFKALSKIAKNAHDCLNNLYSTHEDVEVGRCLKKYAGISCTWSYDMQNLFYHNTSVQDSILNSVLPTKDILNALTIHPIKNQLAMKKLYLFTKNTHYQRLNFKITKLYRILHNIFETQLNPKSLVNIEGFEHIKELARLAEIYGQEPSFKLLKNSIDTPWKFYSQKLYSETSLNPKRNVDRDIINAYNLNIGHLMTLLNRNSFKKGTLFDYHSLYYGYIKYDSHVGMEYILDFLMMYRKFQGKRLTLPLRQHIYAIQTFAEDRIVQLNGEEKPETVNVIIPLAGRLSTFERFAKIFGDVQEQDPHVTLTIGLFPENQNNITSDVRKILDGLGIPGEILEIPGRFSRAKAFENCLPRFDDRSLLFFLDVDMYFNRNVLDRIRRNTIINQQTYFPIVFSQYQNFLKNLNVSSSNDSFETIVNEETGYWRQFGYGIVSLYKQDLKMVGGYNTTITGWGMEDVDLYDRFIASNISIFRAPDPDLIHIRHKIHCDRQLPPLQFEMCLGTKFFSLDSLETIAKFIGSHGMLSD